MSSHRLPLHQKFVSYWDEYYSKAPQMQPSPFARFVAEKWLTQPARLLEIGCGNGRDSIWFSRLGHDVTGVDLSSKAIESCREQNSDAAFLVGDFSELNLGTQFGVVYSRFTLHSIDEATEKRALRSVHHHLLRGGLFLLEARTVLDELCGIGEKISDHEWIHEDHYRRFLEPVSFLRRVQEVGFRPDFILMSNGLAPWGELDPVVIRLALRKI